MERDQPMNNPKNSRRGFISGALRSSLFTLIASSPLLSVYSKAEIFGKIPDDMPDGQSVYRIKGDVLVDGEFADDETFISANSLIQTGSNALIIFVVGSDAHILRENSQLQLSGSSFVETGLKLATGKLLSVFGKREGTNSVSINTSTATIGIRGTGVYAESHDTYSYFCTCYGQAEIVSKTNPNETELVTATYHDSPRQIFGKNHTGKLIEVAPVINHTDEELMLIEALVGRTTPFAAYQNTYGNPRRSY